MVRINMYACNTGDLGSIPGSGRSSGEGNGNPLHILAWRISWAEEPGSYLCPRGHKELDTTNYHKLVSYLSFFFPIVNQGIFL